MKSILIVVAALALASFAEAADQMAQAKCRSLHHVDADPSGTSYSNNHCMLNCNIHGRIFSHAVNDGQSCLLGSGNHVCQNGQCVGSMRLGHIDIEVVSASLNQRINAYATVCIQNSSVPMTLPIQDRHTCVSCSTNVATSTNHPNWHSVCAGSGKYMFVDQSRVSIEVWDHHGQGNNVFMGGASLTIPQMLNHGDNHREINLSLTGGHASGQVTTRITWTPTH